jgi:hypothetical protein
MFEILQKLEVNISVRISRLGEFIALLFWYFCQIFLGCFQQDLDGFLVKILRQISHLL